ncbi:MAG: Fic family protein, partial [Bacilli bacterium]|nr:Fic family protein [Bacilli bacterium]
DQFKHEVIKEDLFVMSMQKDYKIGEKDIEILMDDNNLQLKNTLLYGFYNAHRYLVDHPNLPIDKNLFKDLLSKLLGSDLTDPSQIYRTQNNIAESADYLAIPELMNQFFDYYNAGFSLSPFIVASILFIDLMYIQPFQNFNEEIATLLFMKVLQQAGYGASSYYLSIGEFILQKHGEFITQFEEIKHSGDMTYGVVFLSRLAYDAIEWRCKALMTLPEPEPSYGNVRVIEKVVEKVVEKEVPVYIEKPVPQPIIEEKIVHQEIEPERESEEKEPPENEVDIIKPFVAPVESKKSTYEFEQDPFLKFEAKKEEPEIKVTETVVEEEITKPQVEVTPVVEPTPIPEVKVEPVIQSEEVKPQEQPVVAPKEKPKPQEQYVAPKVMAQPLSNDIKLDLDSLEGLEETEYAQRLVEMQPLLKYRQALFFATHRVYGSYYTIGQFKKFNECAYETARTSMDFLTSLGLYRKEQLKNKFVYTPATKIGGEF